MKLVLVVSSFPKLSETFIVTKFLGLLAAGWDVHIVCRRSDKLNWAYFPDLEVIDGIKKRVHVAWPLRPLWLTVSLMPLALARIAVVNRSYLKKARTMFGIEALKRAYLDAEIAALKPDIVHFEFGPLAVGKTYLKDLLDIRLTVSFRGYDLNYIGLDAANYYGSIWDEVDGLHLLGHDLWARAQRRGCPSDKFYKLIPPAINTDFFDLSSYRTSQTIGTKERPLRLLSVGRLEWKKGYEYALQAMHLLEARGIFYEYRIVGDGKGMTPIAFARHQLGLKESVKFLGAQPQTEVKAQMEWADIFLHTAVSEGFCNAVLEAQAMQLPIITSDADGLPENVANGETGFVVPRRNPEAIVEKLVIMANDPALCRQFGEAGRKRVTQHFQMQQQIEAFDSFYKEVL